MKQLAGCCSNSQYMGGRHVCLNLNFWQISHRFTRNSILTKNNIVKYCQNVQSYINPIPLKYKLLHMCKIFYQLECYQYF